MPRCKECNTKFLAQYFLQKVCSNECLIKFREKNKPKSIKKVSTKRGEQNIDYKIVRDEYLYQHHVCERCFKKATEVHHKSGRWGRLLTKKEFFMAVCRPCHTYIHEHPIESRERGWLI